MCPYYRPLVSDNSSSEAGFSYIVYQYALVCNTTYVCSNYSPLSAAEMS